jgi:Na+/citrate or Na+/malate symporter
MSDSKGYTIFGLKPVMFAVIAAVTLVAILLGVLPTGMAGAWLFMIVLGAILNEIGNHTPFVKTYLGGGAIVVIFGTGLLYYFGAIPEPLYKSVSDFFKPTGAFLDFYIAALITGSILGMNRKLLVKAAARYFPAIFGAVGLSFLLASVIGWVTGYGVVKTLLLIALPIMGGGMGAGAVPLSKIFESSGTMTAQEAMSVMTPAVAIGNALSIVMGGLVVRMFTSKTMNGQGQLIARGVDPREMEISDDLQAARDKIDLAQMGIGLLISCAFFTWGYIVAKLWNMLGTGISIHAYAWMIITVAIFKVFEILPTRLEIACYQWYQFIMKNLTSALLVGIGLCYLSIDTVIKSFSLTYLILCGVTVLGAFFGAAFVGKLVGFYPVEAGITAGLCMANMGGTGDVAVMSAANRMELMPFSQISSRLGGAIILIIGSLMMSTLAGML